MTDSLARQEKVTLVGFGTFQVIRRKERTGRNPEKVLKTGSFRGKL